MDILKKEPKYDCSILNPKQDWKAWLNTVGPYTIQKTNDKYIGEIKISHEILKFNVIEGDNKLRFQVDGTTGKISITSLFTKALTKTAFCERCGVCEAECPTGALRIRKNELYIDTTMCIHCHKCYDVNSYACIVAARKRVTEGGNNMNSTKTRTSGIDRYSTFGLKDEWVGSLVDLQDEWFAEYPGMGNKMIPASINWLREGGIIDLKDKKISEFGKVFSQLYNKNKYLAYQLLWVNLCFNSPIINFYVNKTACYSKYSKQDLLALLQYEYPGLKENTLSNPINAMYNMFEHISYFGSSEDMFQFEDYSIKMGVYSNIGKERYLKKIGTDNINKAAIVYLLYKQAEISGIYDFTLNDFYSSNVMGPSIVFNFPIEKFITMLRNLTENGILTAELQGGLDNIHLNKNFNSLELLKKMVF